MDFCLNMLVLNVMWQDFIHTSPKKNKKIFFFSYSLASLWMSEVNPQSILNTT